MNNPMISQIERIYEKKRDKSEREKLIRQRQVYKELPRVEDIDDQIRKIGIEMARKILFNPSKNEEIISETKTKIENLKMEKAFLLTENNLSAEYLEPIFECSKCKDTGYVASGERCSCMKQLLINRAYKMSNLENVLEKENFSNFKLEIFSDDKFEDEDKSPKENISDIIGYAEDFIQDFDKKNGDNLLFYGTTGLGKTYMCNCIAKALLDKNKIVIYQTAFTILDILEKRRFRKDTAEISEYEYDLLFKSDLLIIDDLGTEVSNTFTNAEIFNIVNTRLLWGKKTIISTNLTPNEISEIYTDRVFSRIFDKFIPLKFFGKDLRWE